MKHILIVMFLVLFLQFNIILIKKELPNIDSSQSKLFKFLLIISYSFPLCLFLKESEQLSEKEQNIDNLIDKLNLKKQFNLRGFMALRFSAFLTSIILYILIICVNKSIMGDSFNLGQTFLWLAILLLLSFVPDLYLKKKEKEYNVFCYDEVIVLQLFLILLLKSGSTISDILYSFSKMKTFYKETFEKAYRISIRNQREALAYLENKFSNLKFGSSFEVLKDLSDYSKKDSLRILETNLKTMEEDILNDKLTNELTKFSYSQVSVVVPFLIVVFLGAIPIIKYGVETMTNSIIGF